MLTLGIILPILAQQKEIDVYLVGGQSNATGQAYVKNIPASFKIDTRVRIYYSRFLNKGEGSEQWNPLCQASETKEFNSENMLFVYGTVIPIAASRFTGRELVRKAQFAVSNNSNSEFSVNNALLIPADDLQMLYNDYQIQHLKMMYI